MKAIGTPLLLALLTGPAAFAQDDSAEVALEAPAAPLPITVPPALDEFVEAVYPADAAAAGIEGVVMLLIAIDAQGIVTSVEVTTEPMRQVPEELVVWGFGVAAADAARQWRFSPAQDPTGPVPVAIEFAYEFKLPPPEPPPVELGPVQISGTLLEMGTRRPLNEFPVVATDRDGQRVEVLTDAAGRFQLQGLAPGPVSLTATYPGFDHTEQVLELDDRTATVKLWLKNLSFKEDELVGYYRLPGQDMTRRTITTEEIKRIPGTFGDPVRVVQNLPGAARAPLGTGLLVIRGANPEDSAVYVDGIRIPFIYHLGGYVSVINADLVDSIDYLPGGYGVEYGRSMGGVLDVKTKRQWPDRKRAVVNADVLDAGVLFAGKVGKDDSLGLGVAARRSYIDAIVPFFTKDSGFTIRPIWWDYQFKLDVLELDRGHFSVFIFGFEDTLKVATPESFAQGTDQDTQGDIGTRYGTHRAMLRWDRPIGEKLELHFVPSFGLDLAQLNLGEEFDLDQQQWLWEIRSELLWKPNEALAATAGVDFIGGWYDFETRFPFDPLSFTSYDPLAEREPYIQAGSGSGWGPDTYLELAWRPLQDRERLLIAPGLRADYVNIVGQYSAMALDPRIMTRARILKKGSLKAGAGFYHQPPQPFESWRPDGEVVLGFERALSAEVGFEQELLPGLDADVALFYKWLDNQIVSNPELEDFDDQFFVNEGIGRAHGLELIVRQAPVGPVFGWVSYTLSRSVRNDYPERNEASPTRLFGPYPEDEGWYRYSFDQTHILVAVGGYRLPRAWEVSGKVQYVTGNPYTPYAGGIYDVDRDAYMGYTTGEYNSSRMPDFFALDLRVDKTFTFKRWKLELYLDLLNVVRGQNPEFVQYNYDYTEQVFIRGLPFIPSPGFQAEFEF